QPLLLSICNTISNVRPDCGRACATGSYRHGSESACGCTDRLSGNGALRPRWTAGEIWPWGRAIRQAGFASGSPAARRLMMNFEKYTERARGFVQAAQTYALGQGHQNFVPEHLLKVLLDDSDGMAAGLIERAGGRPKEAAQLNEQALAKLPKVSGAGAQLYLSPALAQLFAQAEQLAEKAGDSYVTVERLLLAIALAKETEAGKALAKAGVTANSLNSAINQLRQGRTADSQSAENQYDALKKYARDLTQDARDGKLDPVIGRDDEIRRTIQVLSRRTKNNPVLIGEPGVGKTAIAEGL